MWKALIIDDEKPVRMAVSKLGRWSDFQIEPPFTASNGREALDLMREVRPEIVFVDMSMPIMNGMDFLEAASKEFPGTCFLIISGYDDFAYAQQAIRFGVLDYLLKPIAEEELNDAILRAVRTICPQFRLTPKDGTEANADADAVIRTIHEYIDKNYSQNIKLSMFADRYYFSKEYLTRQFKAEYKCGIYEYVLQVRMRRAKELLLDPDIKIQEVASRVGYTDNNYFSKAFRTYYGITPTAFRQELGIAQENG